MPLLEQHWRAIVGDVESARVTVVLSNVNFVDVEGERLLKRMADRGAEFVVEGCMNRYVIEKLRPKCARNRTKRSALRRSVAHSAGLLRRRGLGATCGCKRGADLVVGTLPVIKRTQHRTIRAIRERYEVDSELVL